MSDSDRPAALQDYPVVIALPVQWGDQDAFGHVNNVIYIRWCESARIAYFEQSGFDDRMDQHRLGPILASITCNYRQQLTYPDTVHIGARVSRLGNSSFGMEHKIVGQASGLVAAEVESTIVVFDYETNQSRPLPDDVRARISEVESW